MKDEKWKYSVISNKYPTYRDIKLKTAYSWLDGKRIDDNAEGLWRIHNSLYDFSSFIKYHPGGSFWLEQTKGTDITEAFESHHISLRPERLLCDFKVRNAEKPRNMTLTLKTDGFYKILKSRIREQLKYVNHKRSNITQMIHFSLLVSTIITSILCASIQSYILAFVAALFLSWTVIAAHNYFHQKDNWQMYTFNLCLMNFRDWRISHALSHHIYTNSYHDFEISAFEPYLCWIPNPYIKNIFQRYGSWIYGPLIIYPLTFIGHIIFRILHSLYNYNIMELDDVIGFLLPITMLIFSGETIFNVLHMWLTILIFGGIIFGIIGLNAAHHHPIVHHDGDAVRDDRDWGLFQLDAVMDRSEIKGSLFFTLTSFGDHALHHLFPTIDHAILPELYPILYDTVKEFHGQIRECNWLHQILGQNLQLARIKPNKNPPGKSI